MYEFLERFTLKSIILCSINLAIIHLSIPKALAAPIASEPTGRELSSTEGKSLTFEPWLIAETIPEDLENSPGDTEELSSLNEALKQAESLKDRQWKATFLSNIAVQYAGLGQVAKAKEILDQALETALTIYNDLERATVLGDIALKLADIGESALATEVLSQAREAIDEIKKTQVRASLLRDLSFKYAKIGDSQTEAELLAQIQDLKDSESESVAQWKFKEEPLELGINFGGDVTSERKTVTNFNIGLDVRKQWLKDYFETDFSFRINIDDSRREEDRRRFSLNIDQLYYQHHFSKRWSYVLGALAQKKDSQRINFRSLVYTGIGLNLWRGEGQRRLTPFFGVGHRYENYDDFKQTRITEFPNAIIGFWHQNYLFSDWKLDQFFIYAIPVENSDNSVFNFLTTLRIPIVGRLSLKNTLLLRYFAQPALARENDVNAEFRFSLRYSL